MMIDEYKEEQILVQMLEYLKNENGLKDVLITADSRFILDLGFNSYELVEMCVQLENIFDIDTDEDDFRDMETVGDVVGYIYKKQSRLED